MGRIAWKRRSLPCLAEPPADSPFDDVQLAQRRVALLAVGELAGQGAVVERALAPHQVARLPRRLARAGGVHRLRDDALRDRRVLVEVRAELVVDDGLDDALDLGVAELGLRLALELRPRDLDADDAGEALADVVAAHALARVLGQLVLRRVEVDRAREGRAEARQVRAALVRVDVVRERVDRLGVRVVPLQRDLGDDAVLVAAHVDRLLVHRHLVLVQVRHERDDAAVVVEVVALALALVVERDAQARVQERQLAQPLRQRVEASTRASRRSRRPALKRTFVPRRCVLPVIVRSPAGTPRS